MNRDDFDHAIRAAGSILRVAEVIVIGSQAIHGAVGGGLLPDEALRSVEVDIVPMDDADEWKADLVDGSIGEGSMFHATFGIYAHGVSESTARAPAGWRDRLVRYESSGTNGVVAWCLEPHDLWLAKAVAGRDKDRSFCAALLRDRLVDPLVLRDRARHVEGLAPRDVERVLAMITNP